MTQPNGSARCWSEAELTLRVLVAQAWELRTSPYFEDALAAIGDWHDRRWLTAFERREGHHARLVRVLRETDPDQLPLCNGKKAA